MKIYSSLFLLLLFACQPKAQNDYPNILLVSVDDMGWSDLSCYGSEINTPNIDQLATEGMRFRNFHNTSKCFPSRACLLTGLYAQDVNLDKQHSNPIENGITLGEYLKLAGYRTLFSGKHHGIESPYDRGFDRYYGLRDGCANHFNPGKQRAGEGVPAQKRKTRFWGVDSVMYSPYTPPKGFYSTDYFTKYALDWLKEYKEEAQPFFLYLSYTAPHDPLMAWESDIKKYNGVYDKGYESIRNARFAKQKEIGLIQDNYVLSKPTFSPWETMSKDEQQFEAQKMEVYAAMIDRVDQNIGNVLSYLKETGQLDNTLILFVSDNGASSENVNLKDDDDQAPVGSMERWVSQGKNWANVSNTPFRMFKNYSYQGGINTPCIAYWKGRIPQNSFSNFPGHFIDIMATFADITGVAYPHTYNDSPILPLRGESLLPAFAGGNDRESPLFWQWKNGSACRLGDWKIVRNKRDAPWNLYNLAEDPTETLNLASQHPLEVEKMDQLYTNWCKQYDSK